VRIHLTLLSLILLVAACRTGAGNAATSKFKAPHGDSTAIIAGVDTLGITKGQIEKMLQPMTVQIAQQAQQSGQSFDAVAQPMRRQITAQLLLQQIMKLEAAKLGIKVDAHRVDSVYKAFSSQYGDSAKFTQAMLQAGDNPTSLREKISIQLASSEALEKGLADSLKVAPASVDSFYAANKDRMGEAGKVKARHILKLTKSPADSAKAHAEILAIAAKLAKGMDFAAIATAESDDPGSKGQGGDLGWFNPKEMVPEFAAALSTMKPGETSAPVHSQFGWHIIKLEDRKTGGAPSLDSVRTQIENVLKGQRAEKIIPGYYRALVKKYKAAVLDSAYKEPELFDEPKAEPVGQGLAPMMPKKK